MAVPEIPLKISTCRLLAYNILKMQLENISEGRANVRLKTTQIVICFVLLKYNISTCHNINSV
jgi:hypothetical protein